MSKNLVAAELADECLVQLAYAIGVAEPVSINVNTYGTGKQSDLDLAKLVINTFDCTPKSIIDRFSLQKAIYRPTAAYGHFGRNEFPWEALDFVEKLHSA